MAPKRSAKKAAPPPPAASSEETDSRSHSEESEDDDAIAESPPLTPNSTPVPPQKGEEDDESDEEEEEEEESDDEESAHADPTAAPTPKNQLPPPQQREDPETSDKEEEEEEKEEPTQAAPPSASKKQPPPQQTDEEEEEGESEEEEEEAPPKQAPKQVPEAVKPPAAFSRIWSTNDDVRILEALAAHQKQHGTLPQPDALVDALAGKLDNRAYGSKELQGKVGTLKRRYLTLSNRGELPSKEHDRRVLDLSKTVWGSDKSTAASASVKAPANDHKRKRFEEMCELFPYLAEVVKELMVENPGMFKREFGKMDDEKARVMDEKIKRQRVAQMKVGLRRHDLTREVTKAIINLVH